jgi:uncharacterized protein (TIGR02145 family)
MKHKELSLVLIPVFLLSTFCSCKEDKPVMPDINTIEVTLITPVSANCSGIVISEGSSWIIEKGICWSEHQNPKTSDNKIIAELHPKLETYNLRFEGLTKNTSYYVRAYAINDDGTGYGNELTFTTTNDISGLQGTVNDIEGNVYKTIGIGSQIWMAENLKTTIYNDGTAILNVTDQEKWSRLDAPPTPAYCWYDNDGTSNKEIYGALYNWYVINTGKLCPTGWHVPALDEWSILGSYLGGDALAGGKMKVAGTDYWLSPNQGATNQSCFSALPGGKRGVVGFSNKNNSCTFWTSSINQTHSSWYKTISIYDAVLMGGSNVFEWGLSIRCIKD